VFLLVINDAIVGYSGDLSKDLFTSEQPASY